ILYFLIVNVLRRQRLLRDPEVMKSDSFLLEVMPRQVIMKENKKLEMLSLLVQLDQPATVSTEEIPTETKGFTESDNQSEKPCIKEYYL
ncbi:hypothetical protein MKX03_000755, partial [Papaver bracteatum]